MIEVKTRKLPCNQYSVAKCGMASCSDFLNISFCFCMSIVIIGGFGWILRIQIIRDAFFGPFFLLKENFWAFFSPERELLGLFFSWKKTFGPFFLLKENFWAFFSPERKLLGLFFSWKKTFGPFFLLKENFWAFFSPERKLLGLFFSWKRTFGPFFLLKENLWAFFLLKENFWAFFSPERELLGLFFSWKRTFGPFFLSSQIYMFCLCTHLILYLSRLCTLFNLNDYFSFRNHVTHSRLHIVQP